MDFKQLRQTSKNFSKLLENSSTNVATPQFHSGTPIGDVDDNHMYIEDSKNRDKLNFWLKTMNPSHTPIMNPTEFMISVRTKLNLAGYDIDVTHQTELSDHNEFKLKQFGGRSGMDQNGVYFKDDGISHRNNGKEMKLCVDVLNNSSGEGKIINMNIEDSTQN